MEKGIVEGLLLWLKETKGITKIHIDDLVEYIPEYQNYLEEEKTNWTANHIQCDLCNHKWTSVYPEELDRIQCPNCDNMVTFEKL